MPQSSRLRRGKPVAKRQDTPKKSEPSRAFLKSALSARAGLGGTAILTQPVPGGGGVVVVRPKDTLETILHLPNIRTIKPKAQDEREAEMWKREETYLLRSEASDVFVTGAGAATWFDIEKEIGCYFKETGCNVFYVPQPNHKEAVRAITYAVLARTHKLKFEPYF